MGNEFSSEHDKEPKDQSTDKDQEKESFISSIREMMLQNPDEYFRTLKSSASLLKMAVDNMGRDFMMGILSQAQGSLQSKLQVAMDGWGVDTQVLETLVASSSTKEKEALLNDKALMGRLRNELSTAQVVELLTSLGLPLRVQIQAIISHFPGDLDLLTLVLNGADPMSVVELAQHKTDMQKLAQSMPVQAKHALCDYLMAEMENTQALGMVFFIRYGIHLDSNGLEAASNWLTSDGDSEAEWGVNGIRRVYNSFQVLPESHLRQVTHIMCMGTDEGANGFASQSSRTPYMAIGYRESDTERVEQGAYTNAGDAMQDLNMLDSTVLHELAHRVDCGQKYSGKESFQKISGWKGYETPGKTKNLVGQMIKEMNNPLPSELTKAEERIAVKGAEQAVNNSMQSVDALNDELTDIYEKQKIEATGDAKKKVRSQGALFDALKDATLFQHITTAQSGMSPWFYEPFGYLPDVQFHDSYGWNEWWQYNTEARQNKLSQYQFRDPGEEFAELYATYYVSEPLGAKVPDALKKWFEEHVVKKG